MVGRIELSICQQMAQVFSLLYSGVPNLFMGNTQFFPSRPSIYSSLVYLSLLQSTHNLQNMASGHSLRSDGSDTSPWITFDFFTKASISRL